METTYYSTKDGGLSKGDLIPEISKLAKENTNFSDTDKLGGLLHDGKVTSVLTGASKPQQILDNIGALKNTHFSDEELKLIDEISAR